MANTEYAVLPVAVNSLLIGITTLALALRFLSRHLSSAGFWWDDWLALAAWPCAVVICLTLIISSFHGFGHHHGNPTFFLKVLYYDELVYNAGIALAKLSVLCFYYRIFTHNHRFTQALCATGIFVLVWLFTFEMASILQCVPIQGYWDPKIKAKCVEKFPFFIGQAVPNIACDFVLLLLPLRPLWKLQMRPIQRSALIVVFVLGYLNPLISILRIVSFIQLGRKTGVDINYNFVPPSLWSATEVAISIFSCSIPSLTYLFRRSMGISIERTHSHSSGTRTLDRFGSLHSVPSVVRTHESSDNSRYLFRPETTEHGFYSKSTATRGSPVELKNDEEAQDAQSRISVRTDFTVDFIEA